MQSGSKAGGGEGGFRNKEKTSKDHQKSGKMVVKLALLLVEENRLL